MPQDSAEWNKYRAAVREFEAILEHATAVSASLVGVTPDDRHLNYGEQIFVKLLAHCVTLRRLAPDPARNTPSQLWDLPSMSSIARCAIEAHDAFMYIALGNVSQEERAFRLLLWELHDKTRRRKMLEAIGSRDPRNDEICAEAERLLGEVKAHSFYTSLSASIKRKIVNDDPPAYYLSQRERCQAYGVNFEYYNAVTMQLSPYVHTLPFAIHQLFQFRAGTSASLPLMSLPLQYTLPFLSRVTDEMRQLFPGLAPSPPSRTARSMAVWRTLATRGVKRAG